ncbi:MAG: hypothetical protein AOA65_1511 [Candidatus Bathyarchaeota archaeon BA1]|nr:MAG: hypothetical protein AOA65_1511 [Candidatus Bathyarchaeota archaeon BA1]
MQQIKQITITTICHATEDPNMVVEAAQHILPSDCLDDIVFERDSLRGHHGNPIILLEAKIKKKEIVQAIMERLSSGLNGLDKEILLREIGLHVEKGSLYIRLDKQAALQGEFKLCTADPIRVRIRFGKGRIEDIIEICKGFGISP